jgi:hypothetical protein
MTIEIQQKRPYGTFCYRPVIKDGNRLVWEGDDYTCDENGKTLATKEAEEMLETLKN